VSRIGGPFRRRVRRPFGKASRRPVRWIDAASKNADECQFTNIDVLCTPTTGRELISGDLDIEWVDKNEVVLERLVGSLSYWASTSLEQSFPAADGRDTPNLRMLVRTGILVREELGSAAAADAIDLFDNESIEEYEWMYLHQHAPIWMGDNFSILGPTTGFPLVSLYSQWTEDLDLRVKRKLGKKDHLMLFQQWAAGPGAFDMSLSAAHLLRQLIKS